MLSTEIPPRTAASPFSRQCSGVSISAYAFCNIFFLEILSLFSLVYIMYFANFLCSDRMGRIFY